MCERLFNLQEIYVSGQNICIEVYGNSLGTITPYLYFLLAGHRHINHPSIDHPYKCHENANHSRIPQLQGPYPYQQIKVRARPVASITKKHGGMQHPVPVVPTKSRHSKSDGKNLKCEISPPLIFRRLQSNKASYKIIQT